MAHKRFLGKYDHQKIWLLRFVRTLAIFVVVVFLLFKFVLGVTHVSGESMAPTLRNRQMVVYSRLSKHYYKGDIIFVKMSNGDYFVKRVVAVEGDVVDIQDGVVYVNGLPEEGVYVNGTTEEQEDFEYPLKVEYGKLFLLGDNREVSIDSRTYGAFSKTQVQGKILFHD